MDKVTIIIIGPAGSGKTQLSGILENIISNAGGQVSVQEEGKPHSPLRTLLQAQPDFLRLEHPGEFSILTVLT